MNLITKLKQLRHSAYLSFCRCLPIQNNKIILWSDNFKSFGCSPKYIALYLTEHYPDRYDIVWVLERNRKVPDELPKGIRIVRYFSMEYLKEIATAKVIICNARTSSYHYFHKRKGQYYIQTWHSSLRLKKIEGDAALSQDYVSTAKADSAKIDLLLSGCRFSTDIFRRAFWYSGNILEKGTPRCDGFFHDLDEAKRRVCRFYGINEDKKLALYAPTFRNDKTASIFGMDFRRLSATLGDDWVIGCRLHPNLNAEAPAEHCIPMSNYPDMQELLQYCDMLITDYSSSMFDMAVAGKKCILYVPDLESYISKDRGLYFNIEDLPFPKATDMDSLCAAITDWQDYERECADFLKAIGSFEDGNAAREASLIIEQICFDNASRH